MSTVFTVKMLKKGDGLDWVRLTKVGRSKIGIEKGDAVSIRHGKNKVRCVVHSGLVEDGNDLVCRISKKSREELGIGLGDNVEIAKSENGSSKDKKKRKKTEDPKKIEKGTPEICILAIDCSESMRGQKFNDAKEAVRAFLETKGNILEGDSVGCAGFDAKAYRVFGPTTDYKKAESQIKNLRLEWGTDIGVALDFAREMILNAISKKSSFQSKKTKDMDEFARHIILVADGNGNPHTPSPAAKKCREMGIIVDVVGIVDSKGSLQEGLLKEIADITGGKYFSVDAKGEGPVRLQTIFRRRSEKLG